MNKGTIEIFGIIAQLIIQFGWPAVQAGINALGKDEVTLEDIEALKGLIKPPEEY